MLTTEKREEIKQLVIDAVENRKAEKKIRKKWNGEPDVYKAEILEQEMSDFSKKRMEALERLAKIWEMKGDRGYCALYSTDKAEIKATRIYRKLMNGEIK